MYGKRRSGSKFGKKRTLGTLSANRIVSMVKKGIKISNAGQKPKFATVGFTRNVERKYLDKTYQSNSSKSQTGGSTTPGYNNGIAYISDSWGDYSFGSASTTSVVSNDMVKNLITGTTARSRVGNKIKVNYIKGAFSFTAALIDRSGTGNQNGEAYDNPAMADQKQYLRTTYRFVIVKDLQVNSTDANVKWQQVFDTTNKAAAVHSELNVDNMGRFIVLEDKYLTVDANTPMKTIQFMIQGSQVGNVRYNGDGINALTDKGIYVVWSAFVMGFNADPAGIVLPSPVGHSRMCFTDD